MFGTTTCTSGNATRLTNIYSGGAPLEGRRERDGGIKMCNQNARRRCLNAKGCRVICCEHAGREGGRGRQREAERAHTTTDTIL